MVESCLELKTRIVFFSTLKSQSIQLNTMKKLSHCFHKRYSCIVLDLSQVTLFKERKYNRFCKCRWNLLGSIKVIAQESYLKLICRIQSVFCLVLVTYYFLIALLPH